MSGFREDSGDETHLVRGAIIQLLLFPVPFNFHATDTAILPMLSGHGASRLACRRE